MFVQTSNVPVSQKVLKSAVDKCQYYYREMLSAGVTPNAKSVNSMLQVLIRGRQPSEAIRLFRNVEERFLSRVDIAMMQKQQQERQQFTLQQHEEVRTLRERFETDKKRRMDKEGEVAASPFPADDDLDADFVVPKALATSEDEVLDRNVANPRAVVDIITYNTMVALHLRFKDFASATALLETSMPRASVQPNSWTYTLLLDRARACGRDDVVEKCVEDLVRIRKERGVLLGGLVVGDGPLHRQLKIIQKMDRDKLPLTDETLQSIEWLKTSARLANDKYHRTQNKRKSSAKGATGLDALNGSAKR